MSGLKCLPMHTGLQATVCAGGDRAGLILCPVSAVVARQGAFPCLSADLMVAHRVVGFEVLHCENSNLAQDMHAIVVRQPPPKE